MTFFAIAKDTREGYAFIVDDTGTIDVFPTEAAARKAAKKIHIPDDLIIAKVEIVGRI
jgi:hypothetical protein